MSADQRDDPRRRIPEYPFDAGAGSVAREAVLVQQRSLSLHPAFIAVFLSPTKPVSTRQDGRLWLCLPETRPHKDAKSPNIKEAQLLLSRLKEKHEFAFGVDTDIFKQRRTYTIASDINLGYEFQLKVRAIMPGLEVVRPATFDFHFISSSDDWKFLEYHPLIFISDDQRYSWESDEVSHNGDVGRGYVLEQMHVNMPYDQFKQLAYARVVQGRLGIYEFTISDIDREQMRILVEFFEREGK